MTEPRKRGFDADVIMDRVRVLWGAVLAPNRVAGIIRGVLGCVFVALIVLLVRPTSPYNRVSLPDSLVDEVAPRTIVATHPFEYSNVQQREIDNARRSARESVPPVWDYDPSERDAVVARVRDGFERVRNELRTRAETERARLPSMQDFRDEDGEIVDTGQRVREHFDDDKLLLILSDSQKLTIFLEMGGLDLLTPDGVNLGLSISSIRSVSTALATSGFSAAIERELTDRIEFAMTRFVVPSTTELNAFRQQRPDVRVVRASGDARPDDPRNALPTESTHHADAMTLARTHPLLHISGDNRELAESIRTLSASLIVPNTVPNQDETRARRSRAEARAEEEYRARQRTTYRAGQTIVQRGQVVTREIYDIVVAMNASLPESKPGWPGWIGAFLLVSLFLFPIVVLTEKHLTRFHLSAKDLSMMGCLLIAHLCIARFGVYVTGVITTDELLWLPPEAFFALVPFAMGAMIVRILTNAENALVYAIVYSLVIGSLFGFELQYVVYSLIASIIGASAVGNASDRKAIIRASVLVGLAKAALIFAVVLAHPESGPERMPVAVMLAGVASCIITAVAVTGLIPPFEYVFRYTTPMSLAELATQMHHPALHALSMRAPGSYTHSRNVAHMVRNACEAIGANALLGDVGSIFHDIGKSKNPQFFGENGDGTTYHDELDDPYQSAEIIFAHVTDGVVIAKENKLPAEIINFIAEHHGTTLMQHFYNVARRRDGDENVKESDFRYPGPRPQSRETAVCLLADGIEAILKLPNVEKTPENIAKIIDNNFSKHIEDGQLDDSGLTFSDIRKIRESFFTSLTAMHHKRPVYAKAPGEDKPTPGESAKPTSGAEKASAPSNASREAAVDETPADDTNASRPDDVDEATQAPKSNKSAERNESAEGIDNNEGRESTESYESDRDATEETDAPRKPRTAPGLPSITAESRADDDDASADSADSAEFGKPS